jgi:competence protein ComEC
VKRRSFDESDLIRLNLERLDAQTRQPPLMDRLFSEAPLIPFAVAFLLGILFVDAAYAEFHLLRIILACVLLAAAACFGLSFKKSSTARLTLILACSCLLAFALASVRYYSILVIPPNHISHYLHDKQRELATLKGKVISPVLTNMISTDSSIPWLEPKSSFYLKTTEIKNGPGWEKTSGIVRVQTAEPIHHVRPGNTVLIYCWLSRFEPPANPGQFDLSNYMRQHGVRLAATVETREAIEVLDSSSSLITRARSLLHHAAANALLDETMTDDDASALASALLLGQRNTLNPLMMAAFRDTNLAHYISLSGMHVGILAGSLWVALRATGLAKRPRAALCIILILMYALIVPPRAPTMRAVILSCFFFGSVFFVQRPSPMNTLALSAIVLMFIRPYDVFSAGWQLSFLSVLGILLFYEHVRYYLLKWFFYPVIPFFYTRFVGAQHVLHCIIEMLAVGLSAWLAIAGILLFYFGRVNPLSPLWTVLVFPFVIVLLYAGFLKILLSAIFPTAAALLGWLVNIAASGFEKTVLLLAKIDVCRFTSYRPSMFLISVIYLLVTALYLIPSRYEWTKKSVLLGLVFCFFFPSVWQNIMLKNRNTLEMVCLSVGHGQAIVLSGPANEYILFDAGSITHQQIAEKTIAPYLQYRSIFKLDAAYLSHGDLDHINGLSDLAAYVPIRSIYSNCALIESAQKPSVEKDLKDRFEELHQTLTLVEDYHDSKGLTITSLWPSEETAAEPSILENDKSQVLLIEYAGRKILLCGDIEIYAQQKLLHALPELRVDVLVLPHHGSTTNLNPGFVENFKPQAVIASCATNRVKNAYHPPTASGTQAFYTATDGAVTVKIKADSTLTTVGYLSQ